MNRYTRWLSTKYAVQAYYYYLVGEEKMAENLIAQSLTLTYPVGNLLTQLLN